MTHGYSFIYLHILMKTDALLAISNCNVLIIGFIFSLIFFFKDLSSSGLSSINALSSVV